VKRKEAGPGPALCETTPIKVWRREA
jgi:hypothetical protein